MAKTINKEVVLEIVDLTKKYGKEVVFRNLNLKIYKGDRVALIGANGVGKTTLVEMICGLRKITSGEIVFPGGRKQFFDSLGVQFQTGEYPLGITVGDLVYLYSSVYGKKISKELKDRLQITTLENKEMTSLSYGQKRRVDLFLLLAINLNFLILDEVTSGMDIAIRTKTIEIMQKHIEENDCGIIYVSHNMDEISNLCNRLIILSKRKVVFDQRIDKHFDVYAKMKAVLKEDEKKKSV